MTAIDLNSSVTVVGGGSSTPAPAPSIDALHVVGTNIQARISLPIATGTAPSLTLRLHRAPTPSGPWEIADEQPLQAIAAKNHLFDQNPFFAVETFYAATVLDGYGVESAMSEPVSISAPPQ